MIMLSMDYTFLSFGDAPALKHTRKQDPKTLETWNCTRAL